MNPRTEPEIPYGKPDYKVYGIRGGFVGYLKYDSIHSYNFYPDKSFTAYESLSAETLSFIVGQLTYLNGRS